ncbi:hypothetical protein ACU4GD_33235 [Cupriavidus basilensis]
MMHIFISSAGAQVRPGAAIGKVVPGYVAQIVDESMQPVPPARSASWRCAAHRAAVPGRPAPGQLCEDGWNLPGDTFMADADGYYYYQARSDDMIVLCRLQHCRAEVEAR